MPVGDVLVGDAGCDVKHDDTALAVDVVTVTQTTELLLACGVPNIELNLAKVLQGDQNYTPFVSRCGDIIRKRTVSKPSG